MPEVIFAYSLLAFFIGYLGFKHSRHNAFGGNFSLNLVGAFVWGDAAIFGVFWGLASLFCAIFNQTILFLLLQSVFWFIRSLGEINYWMHEQFATQKRNTNLPHKQYFSGDSILFINQICWQCLATLTLVSSIYLAHTWLN